MSKNNNNILWVLLAAVGGYFLLNKKTAPTQNATNTGTNTNNTTGAPVIYPAYTLFNNNFYLLTNVNILIDQYGNIVGNNVTSYDATTDIVKYFNGYTLNRKTGILTDSKGIKLVQTINHNNLDILSNGQFFPKGVPTYFPVPSKVYGYDTDKNLFYYLEQDKKTTYTITDGQTWCYYGGVYPGFSQYYYSNTKSYFTPLKVQVLTPNIPVFSAGFVSYLFQLFATLDSMSTWMIGQQFVDYSDHNTNIYSVTHYGVFNLTGTTFTHIGVVYFSYEKQMVYFDDGVTLDIENNYTLYDKMGAVINKNIKQYSSVNAWSYFGKYTRQNGNSYILPDALRIETF
jgi:hypothetical protein